MTLELLKTNQNFCILPFIHQEKKFNGTFHVCCYGDQLQSDSKNDNSLQSFNSKKMFEIRSAMASGKRHEACNFCYKQEDKGIISPRHRENNTWFNWSDTHLAIEKCLNNFADNNEMRPISYDLRYSNTCTLKCRMCNSSSSSSINAEYKKINHLWPEKFWNADNPRINHDIEFHADIQKIYLAGGEPLVEPLNLELLESAAEYNPNLVILINTSLNLVNDRFFNVLNKFKYLTLVVSIDGTYRINDYIRNGSNFEIVKQNIKKLEHHDIMFSTCVSMYNIFNIKNLIQFINDEFSEYAVNHGINLVNDVEELGIENVPYELRPALINELHEALTIAKKFPAEGLQNCILTLSQDNFDQSKFDNFIRYTNILDKSRNESIIDVVPQLAKYFNE
jgi:MoaA/NifB/PqqE/SkfB family radical SAM enzyme